MRIRPASARSVVLAALAALALLGGSAPVLCVHTDGTAALESGADRCCETAPRGAAPSDRPSAAAAAGDCPGCADRLLSMDVRMQEPGAPRDERVTLLAAAHPPPPGAASSARVSPPVDPCGATRASPPLRPLRV